jgi:hypothetical protein
MANIAQATLKGTDLIIQCDDRWDCCQRAQAAAKAKAWNKALPGKGIQTEVSKDDLAAKAKKQRDTIAEYDDLDAEEQGEKAVEDGAPDCVEEKFADQSGNARKKTKYQMDHPLDVKAGGDPSASLTPIDRHVNRAFGSFAKNAGNELVKQKGEDAQFTSVSLVCPASEEGCPDEDHNAGKKKKYPEEEAKKYETTYEAKKGKKVLK